MRVRPRTSPLPLTADDVREDADGKRIGVSRQPYDFARITARYAG